MVDDEFNLLDLTLACSRLRLDAGDLVEAVLSGMDAGFTEREAATMSIIEMLQRRGAYHGRLKRAIDDGTIFQMAENHDGGRVRWRRGRMGGERPDAPEERSAGDAPHPRLCPNRTGGACTGSETSLFFRPK